MSSMFIASDLRKLLCASLSPCLSPPVSHCHHTPRILSAPPSSPFMPPSRAPPTRTHTRARVLLRARTRTHPHPGEGDPHPPTPRGYPPPPTPHPKPDTTTHARHTRSTEPSKITTLWPALFAIPLGAAGGSSHIPRQSVTPRHHPVTPTNPHTPHQTGRDPYSPSPHQQGRLQIPAADLQRSDTPGMLSPSLTVTKSR